ncbi:hypothetical protein [Actinacidiphila glaucinigra]|uniref:hypothetical protein n=1 Tax=Actinacidiphila glaucinigra TaxID=235986 RepID=UPI0036EF1D2F
MSDALVICAHPSFPRPDGTPVLEDPSFTVGGVRTGPVAPNGAGESTFLTLIAGEYGLRGGTVTVDGTLGRPPQSPPPAGDLAVAEVTGVADAVRAIDAVEPGDTAEEHIATVGDGGDLGNAPEAEPDRLGLGDLGSPDEPTDDLDIDARRRPHPSDGRLTQTGAFPV